MIALALIALVVIVAAAFFPLAWKLLLMLFLVNHGESWKEGEKRPPIYYAPTHSDDATP